MFSNGWMGDDSVELGALWQALHDAHVEMLLSGHDHTYQRFQPLNAKGVPDPVAPTQLVVGTGGEELMVAPSKTQRLVVGDSSSFGVLKIQLHANSYDAQFVPIAGQAFNDFFSGTCIQ
jgi:hypothetical protein